MERIISPIEVKASPDDGDGTFIGYPAIFNHPDSDQDVIAPGAFKQAIQDSMNGTKAWPVLLLQHSSDDVIGAVQSMEEDQTGLRISAKIAPTKRGKEILSLMKMRPRPAISGLSIGFRVRKSTTSKTGRTLTDLDLVEISLCVFPANTRARVTGVKSYVEPKPEMTMKDLAWADFQMLRATMTMTNRNWR